MSFQGSAHDSRILSIPPQLLLSPLPPGEASRAVKLIIERQIFLIFVHVGVRRVREPETANPVSSPNEDLITGKVRIGGKNLAGHIMVSAGVSGPKNARTAIARVFLVVRVQWSRPSSISIDIPTAEYGSSVSFHPLDISICV
jgi:hypothetical protein